MFILITALKYICRGQTDQRNTLQLRVRNVVYIKLNSNKMYRQYACFSTQFIIADMFSWQKPWLRLSRFKPFPWMRKFWCWIPSRDRPTSQKKMKWQFHCHLQQVCSSRVFGKLTLYTDATFHRFGTLKNLSILNGQECRA